MALPEGIETCTVTSGVPVTFGGAAVKAYVSIEPSVYLVHTATGTPLVDFLEEQSVTEGVVAQFTLPVDQAGFQDENGNAYRGWFYTARITYSTTSKAKNKTPKTKVFQLVSGQTLVDLDTLPGGVAALPYTAPLPSVTSVNGQTGAVLVDAEPLPARLEEAALNATFAPVNSRYVYPSALGTVTKGAAIPVFTDGQTAAWSNFGSFLRVEGAELTAYGDGTGGRNTVQISGPATAATYRAMIAGATPGKQKVSFSTEWFGGSDWWAFIDGVPVTTETVLNTESGIRYIVFETPDENPHEITLITSAVMRTVTWEKASYLYAPPPRRFRVAVLGDSYVAGSEQIIAGAMPVQLGLAMGWEVYICGQGSTGYSVALGDTSDGRVKYNNTTAGGRLPRIKALFDAKKIDALIVLGSINDGDTAPATGGGDAAAVFTYFRDNAAALPLVSGGSVGITQTTNLTNVNVQISQQAALFTNVKGHFSQYQWFSSNLLIPATPHLNRQGRKIQGQRVGTEARRILQLAGFTAA